MGGKDRLPDPGFYIEWYGTADPQFIAGSNDPSATFSVVYITPEKTCQYIHWMSHKESWSGLLWTCAPTRKKIAAAAAAKPDKVLERYYYFPTHEELCRFTWISHKPGALIKPQGSKI